MEHNKMNKCCLKERTEQKQFDCFTIDYKEDDDYFLSLLLSHIWRWLFLEFNVTGIIHTHTISREFELNLPLNYEMHRGFNKLYKYMDFKTKFWKGNFIIYQDSDDRKMGKQIN